MQYNLCLYYFLHHRHIFVGYQNDILKKKKKKDDGDDIESLSHVLK
mgnify:CR=1 FL=1